MSFNVFDESPENQIVIKEQQSQNKVAFKEKYVLTTAPDRLFSVILLHFGERLLIIYGVLEIELWHYDVYPVRNIVGVIKSLLVVPEYPSG